MADNLTIRLHEQDNVVVARRDIPEGAVIPAEGITTLENIPAGYKIAARRIRQGEPILKYHTVIGYASADAAPGTVMHSHNIDVDSVDKDYAFSSEYVPTEFVPEADRPTFMGYVRKDGRVGTRNYIGVFTTSNCAATVARRISNYFTPERLKAYPNVDGVVPFIIDGGCGLPYGGPLELLQRTIGGYIRHPNIFASVVCALGCERNNIDVMFERLGLRESDTLKRLVMQETGGTRKSIERGIAEIEKILPLANQAARSPVSVSHLTVALQCGGSDGFSGLSANPALGAAMDKLVRNGGTAVLSETTEIFGVEHTLTRRAVTPEVGQKLVDRINWWLQYSEGSDVQINGRVAPGNNKGGLANILEKSLGGAKKGGETGLMDVIEYGMPITAKGLVFMDTPGFDPVAATGQVAGGANLIAFTTGRGSCYGGIPAPSTKIATNTPMYQRMEEDMDINCGLIIDGEKTVQEMGDLIFETLLKVASGQQTKSEALGVGEDEFQPWNIGIIS